MRDFLQGSCTHVSVNLTVGGLSPGPFPLYLHVLSSGPERICLHMDYLGNTSFSPIWSAIRDSQERTNRYK